MAAARRVALPLVASGLALVFLGAGCSEERRLRQRLAPRLREAEADAAGIELPRPPGGRDLLRASSGPPTGRGRDPSFAVIDPGRWPPRVRLVARAGDVRVATAPLVAAWLDGAADAAREGGASLLRSLDEAQGRGELDRLVDPAPDAPLGLRLAGAVRLARAVGAEAPAVELAVDRRLPASRLRDLLAAVLGVDGIGEVFVAFAAPTGVAGLRVHRGAPGDGVCIEARPLLGVAGPAPALGRFPIEPDAPEFNDCDRRLRLGLVVGASGVDVWALGGGVAPGCTSVVRPPEGQTVAWMAGRADWAALARCLARIKQSRPDERDVTLSATPEIRAEELLAAWVVALGRPDAPLFPVLLPFTPPRGQREAWKVRLAAPSPEPAPR